MYVWLINMCNFRYIRFCSCFRSWDICICSICSILLSWSCQPKQLGSFFHAWKEMMIIAVARVATCRTEIPHTSSLTISSITSSNKGQRPWPYNDISWTWIWCFCKFTLASWSLHSFYSWKDVTTRWYDLSIYFIKSFCKNLSKYCLSSFRRTHTQNMSACIWWKWLIMVFTQGSCVRIRWVWCWTHTDNLWVWVLRFITQSWSKGMVIRDDLERRLWGLKWFLSGAVLNYRMVWNGISHLLWPILGSYE